MEWKIPLSDIDLEDEEIEEVVKVLKSKWLSMGPVTQRFEGEFANYLGVKHAFGVSNGTAALHIAHRVLGIKEGDEVIVPSLTFVATANSVLYCGAKPVFADITSLDDFNISPDDILEKITKRTKAITVVHYGGYPCDMDAIMEIARDHGLKVIEDAAHAPGAEYKGRKCGTIGNVGCFSFFANKNLVTGEGGMVVTNADSLAEKIRIMRSHGMTTLTWDRHKGHAHSYDVVDLGFNYRTNEIASAIGLVQLKKLVGNNEKRRRIVEEYRKRLGDISGISVPFKEHKEKYSCHIFPILLAEDTARNEFMDKLKEKGIQTSIHYPPIHLFTFYRKVFGFEEGVLPKTEFVGKYGVTLPLHLRMNRGDVKYITACIREVINGGGKVENSENDVFDLHSLEYRGGFSPMKKVLIVAYFPPHPQASPRIQGLAKYLPEFGWQPIIMTAPVGDNLDSQFRVIETRYRDVLGFWKKLLGLNPKYELTRTRVKDRLGMTSKKFILDFFLAFCAAIITYPDSDRGWMPFAVKASSELLQNEDIDAMISSSSPITSHIIAKELKIKHKLPWVADLRDLWTQNHNYRYGPLRKLIDKRLELKTLSNADALVTVSQPWAEKLRTLHKGKTTYTITNGFDPIEMNTTRVNLTSKFTITYTGAIYTGKQDPSKLFAALKGLISDGFMDPNDVEVRFYGPEEEWLARDVKEYGLSAIVKQYGVVPREIALEKQRKSQLLLHLTWEGRGEKAGYSLKLFEYLAAQRPILAIGLGNDMTRELIDETKSGIYAPTVEDIKSVLRELYSEYKHKEKIRYNGNIEKIDKYSYREMARKFAEILDNIT